MVRYRPLAEAWHAGTVVALLWLECAGVLDRAGA